MKTVSKSMVEASTTSVGLDRSYRNKMALYSSEPASQSKPKVQNLNSGLLDPPGGIDEDSCEELRYEDCISDDESSSDV